MSRREPALIRYFAFGANMAPRVMARRNVATFGSESAMLKDYRLTFDLPGLPFFEPGFANITPATGASVCGVAYWVASTGLERLAAAESEGEHYRRERVDVELGDGTSCPAVAFMALKRRAGLLPSRRYLQLLADGARLHGLPDSYVQFLEDHPCVAPPLGEALMPHVVRAFDWAFQHGLAPTRAISLAWSWWDRYAGGRHRRDS